MVGDDPKHVANEVKVHIDRIPHSGMQSVMDWSSKNMTTKLMKQCMNIVTEDKSQPVSKEQL